MSTTDRNAFLAAVADQVVPAYRISGKSYLCSGVIAKQWNAAYRGAELALLNPEETTCKT